MTQINCFQSEAKNSSFPNLWLKLDWLSTLARTRDSTSSLLSPFHDQLNLIDSFSGDSSRRADRQLNFHNVAYENTSLFKNALFGAKFNSKTAQLEEPPILVTSLGNFPADLLSPREIYNGFPPSSME